MTQARLAKRELLMDSRLIFVPGLSLLLFQAACTPCPKVPTTNSAASFEPESAPASSASKQSALAKRARRREVEGFGGFKREIKEKKFLCPSAEKLGPPRDLHFWWMRTSPAERTGTPFRMRFPTSFRLVDQIDSGAKLPCKFSGPDCINEANSWLKEDSAQLDLCGSKHGSQQVPILGLFVAITKYYPSQDEGSRGERWRDCGVQHYDYGPRLLEGHKSHHQVELNRNGEGFCTVQFSNVQPRVWEEAKRHYYVFGRIGKDREGGTWIVSIVYETYEEDWNLVKDVLYRSAQSFEVDWLLI